MSVATKSPPLLLFTIDVEEDMPDWRITDPISTSNARALPRFAEVCAEFGVRPTYLCTWPMVTEPEPAAILRALARAGGCEIATHLHPWNTPPFEGVPGRTGDERSIPYYLSELGPARFRSKLERLHAAVAEIAGEEPVSFRAGRFGIDGATLAELPSLGYEVDSSVTPMVHHLEDDGPDFRRAPQHPYYPSRTDVCVPGDLPIVEVPVSVGLSRKLPDSLREAYLRIPQRTRLRGLLSHEYLGIVDFAWLYPARFDLSIMRRAATTLLAEGAPVLNVFLHSSELVAGASSYVQTESDAELCFERIRGLLAFCTGELGARPATLAEAGRSLRAWIDPCAREAVR